MCAQFLRHCPIDSFLKSLKLLKLKHIILKLKLFFDKCTVHVQYIECLKMCQLPQKSNRHNWLLLFYLKGLQPFKIIKNHRIVMKMKHLKIMAG